MNSPLTRRRLLAGVGAAASAALAGCPLAGSVRYSLESRPEDGADPVDRFEWRPASNAFHYDRADAERMAEELRASGSVESVAIPLVEERPSGEDGYQPAYTEHEGTYYRVRVEAEPVTVEPWVVWAEPLEELPEGVDHVTDPREREDRSEFDGRVLDRAIDRARSSQLGGDDHAAKPATRRGVVFFEPLSPDDSAFVPEPPFEYALVEPEDHFDPDELPLRFHADREAVETTRYHHELEAVADSRAAFVDHVEAEHVAAGFSAESLSDDERRVLEASTDLTGHDEDGPPSEAFAAVMDALGLGEVSLPADREVASWLRHYRYEGDYYAARLWLSDTSLIDVESG